VPVSNPARRSDWWRPVALIATVAALGALAQWFDAAQHLVALRTRLENLGAWGPIVFALVYIVGVVAALPGSALTAATGALFGSVVGVAIASTAATIGASLSFLIARYFARDATFRWLCGEKRFRQLNGLTARYGAVAVLLTRLSPFVPFNLLNYSFGLTQVRFRTYVFWSWVGILPGAIFVVLASDAVVRAITRGEVPWFLLYASLVAGIAVVILFVWVRKRFRENGVEDGPTEEVADLGC
jgi:uncharacterized membrane protein YdjX (TVP38/TMEM64 family)